MKAALAAWQFWALLAAIFAALTAILAKLGVEQVNADFATFFARSSSRWCLPRC